MKNILSIRAHAALIAGTVAFCLLPNLNATDAVSKANTPRVPPYARPAAQTTEVLLSVSGKAVRGKKAMTAAQYAASKKLPVVRTLQSNSQKAVLRFRNVAEAQKAIAKLKKDAKVTGVSFNRTLPYVPHAFVPNDPFFPQQWYLHSPNAPLPGVNVASPWARNFTGQGVIIGIVDEGIEKNHEDLAPNFNAANSYDFAGDDLDPSPEGEGDTEAHGTSVAGVAAGRGGNGIGITGAAPYASIAGLKVTFDGNSTVADFVNATEYHSSGTNRKIKIKNHSYGFSFPFVDDPEDVMAFNESASAGTIHTVSAGNDRYPYGFRPDGSQFGDIAEDSNKSMLSNNPNVITVAALASSGVFADYSSLGSNIFVTASSSSFRDNELSIVTTDRTGTVGYNTEPGDEDFDDFGDLNYTGTFGGTSSSAPLVAGVLALVKQANPGLNVRMAKQLLAKTSIQVDPSNPTWVRNAAGYHFSTDYGFGLVDANALVNAAKSVSISPQQSRLTVPTNVGKRVPDLGSASQTISLGKTGRIEEIQIRLVVTTEYEGDLEATITSPRGTTSTFCHSSVFDSYAGVVDWWFTSNAFWGEQGEGDWTVTVSDRGAGDRLRWDGVQLNVRSDTVPGTGAPKNDNFANALKLSGQSFTSITNIELATAEAGESDRKSVPANHSIWYEWTAPVAGRLSISTDGSDTDTILTLYTGESLDSLDARITNNNQGTVKKTSNIFTNVSKGAKFFIAVDAAAGAPRSVKLSGTLKGCGE